MICHQALVVKVYEPIYPPNMKLKPFCANYTNNIYAEALSQVQIITTFTIKKIYLKKKSYKKIIILDEIN